MTDEELKRLAGVLWEQAPTARTFTNKQVAVALIAVFIFAFGANFGIDKVLNIPSDLTPRAWKKVHNYAVEDQPKREAYYQKVIEGFERADIAHVQRMDQFDKALIDITRDVQDHIEDPNKHL